MAGFVAVGKTHAAGLKVATDIGEVIDLDSLPFSYLPSGERNPEFTKDYVEAIMKRLPQRCVLLVTAHEELRNALVENGISYTLVHPVSSAKRAWLERLAERGTPQYIPLVDAMWDKWFEQCKNQAGCLHVTLEAEQHLSDVLPSICAKFTETE